MPGKLWLPVLLCALLPAHAWPQTPSSTLAQQSFAPRSEPQPAPQPVGPARAMSRNDRPGSLPALYSRAEFDLLARVHHAGTALAQAVKTVWASVFNPEAWEARSAAGFDTQAVAMAVFVQTAIDATSAGVMITRDPFDADRPYVIYISDKRGIGIQVVEGRHIAEQVTYSSWSKAIQVHSRSGEDTALQLSDHRAFSA